MRVEDFARAFVSLIGNQLAYNEEFNICSEQAHSFNEVLDILSKKLGKEIITIDLTPEQYGKALPERKGEIIAGRSTDSISSLNKYKKLFPDFKEEYSLSEGISKTVDAYRNQNWMGGINYEFDGECDRIIRDYCMGKSNSYPEVNICFEDYFGTATFKDKLSYYINFQKGSFNSYVLLIAMRAFNRLKKLLNIRG